MTVLKGYDQSGVAVGAVGVCGTLISLITGLVIGISAGANVVVARFVGEGNREKVERAVGTSVAVALLGGAVLFVVGVFGAELFLRCNNCPEELIGQATLYFRMYFAGAPLLLMYNFCAAILRAAGDSRRPMIYLTLGGIAKVLCNLFFVAVCKWSVTGVAVATLISWAVSALHAIRALIKTDTVIRLQRRHLRFYRHELAEILRIGVPAGVQQGLYSIANVVITATVNTFGAAAATGISIANQFDNILYQISTAPALAVMPYVSQNVGGGNVRRAKRSVAYGMLITLALGATFGLLSAGFSGQLSSLMSSDPEVIAYSRQKMIIISSTYFICGINEILGAAVRGLGRSVVPTASTLVYLCLLRFVWVYAVFPHLPPNLTFLYLVWPIGWVLSILTLLCFFFPIIRALRRAERGASTV
jgi:putative MATE family efflux protein